MNVRNKLISLSFILIFGFSMLSGMALSVSYATVDETNAQAEDRIRDLREYLIKNGLKPEGRPLIANGHDDSGKVALYRELSAFSIENSIGIAALSKDFQATGNVESDNWAQADMWRVLNNMAAFQESAFGVLRHENSDKDEFYTIDYFMFLEFIGESKVLTGSSEMYLKLNELFIRRSRFYSNSTQYGVDGLGSWLTAIKSGAQFIPPGPNTQDYQYSLTNHSLWAAAGFSSFSLAVRGTKDDAVDQYSKLALQEAEESIGFADAYTFNRLFGLYHEDKVRTNTSLYSFSANTQIVAILACARLSQATGKEIYIKKADAIINALMSNFWDTGRGGLYSSMNPLTGQISGVKLGYDNALFAYALLQLAKVRDLEEFTPEYFIRGKGQNEYFNLAKDVMNYLYNYHWGISSSFRGYYEWVDRDGQYAGPNDLANTTRLTTTNMLALYNLANIIWASRPFMVVYQMYFIVGGGILAVIIMVIVIVVRRSRQGTSLSKITKGLLASSDKED